jgi:branched-chain amino acid transport system substrate-binding protein
LRPALGGCTIDFTFWWVQVGYDSVKVIEHAITKAGSTDPAAIEKAMSETNGLVGSYTTYSWGPTKRDAFPDAEVVMNVAGSFKEGSFRLAPGSK